MFVVTFRDAAWLKTDMAKERHHHGALRDALIHESERLISLRGLEGFTIADACRAAGVSTAAPYKHFENREELIAEVSGLGFRRLTDRMVAARDAHPPGSIEGLIALGRAYLGFVSSDPEMFHLMWGTTRQSFKNDTVEDQGCACFGALIDAIEPLKLRLDLEEIETMEIALSLWSGMHGMAALILGQRLKVVGDLDLDVAVESLTRAYLDGLQARAERLRAEAADG